MGSVGSRTDAAGPSEPKVGAPRVAASLERVDDVAPLLEEAGEGAGVTEGLSLSSVHLEGVRAPGVPLVFTEFSASRVEHCMFQGCDLSKSWFVDVAFEDCDFSNCLFEDANFTRCSFTSCKLIGADLSAARLMRTRVAECALNLASFVRAKLEDCVIQASDLTGADLSYGAQKRTAFRDCTLEGISFFRMGLSGMDLSSCRLGALTISDSMEELKGCRMDLIQAAGIAKRLGVIIVDA